MVAIVPLLTVTSLAVKSATFDEPMHLVHGVHDIGTLDFGVAVEVPPLARTLAGATIRLFGLPMIYDRDQIPWSPGFLTSGAQEILYRNNDADRLLFWGRLPFTLLHMILVVGVFYFAFQCWGPAGAFISALLCVFSPSLLAHSRLITSDFTVVALLFFAQLFLYRALSTLTVAAVILAGVALGLALLSKHSALVCLPIFLLILVARSVVREPWRIALVPGHTQRLLTTVRAKCVVAGLTFLSVCGIALLSVWMFYGLRYQAWGADDPLRHAKASVQEEFRARNGLESDIQESLLTGAERFKVFPEPFLLGVRFTLKHAERRLSYLWGERSIEGSVWYFPVAFALKTPLALFVLCVAAGIGLYRKRVALTAVQGLCVFAFPALYFATTLVAHLNLGLRHLLPIYPFVFVSAGGAGWLWGSFRTRRILLGSMLVWFVGASLVCYPNYLVYFNELAGGPRGGMRFLGDSNLDWGQDLKRLPEWMEQHGVRHIKLGYFGTALPQYYGFSFEWLPSVGYLNDQPGTKVIHEGDYLAVSATCLQGFYFDDMQQYRFLEDFEPIDHIGHSIYLYHITPEQLRRRR